MKNVRRSIVVGFGCLAAAWCLAAGTWASAADEKIAGGAAKAASRGAAEEYVEGDVAVTAAGGCCDRGAMVPVCRCKPTTRKKQKTEYEVKCEPVCVPGCGGSACGKRPAGCCGDGCDGDGCCDTPCCNATVRSKKTLLKKVVDEEEPAMEYEVEWVCATCVGGCSAGGCDADGRGGRRLLGKPSKAWHALRCFWQDLWHWK